MFKVDLHTHSIASPDGALRARDYHNILASGALDFVAITDHNRIDFAQLQQKQLGEKIIVGEEITVREGEIIGLFLGKVVPAGLSAVEAVAAIRAQGGLVYIPHPFETVRKGLSLAALDSIAAEVDVMEIHNGRAMFQNRAASAEKWAQAYTVARVASSDAHGKRGWGSTYSIIEAVPTRENLAELLSRASYSRKYVGILGILYPKINRLRKRLWHA